MNYHVKIYGMVYRGTIRPQFDLGVGRPLSTPTGTNERVILYLFHYPRGNFFRVHFSHIVSVTIRSSLVRDSNRRGSRNSNNDSLRGSQAVIVVHIVIRATSFFSRAPVRKPKTKFLC